MESGWKLRFFQFILFILPAKVFHFNCGEKACFEIRGLQAQDDGLVRSLYFSSRWRWRTLITMMLMTTPTMTAPSTLVRTIHQRLHFEEFTRKVAIRLPPSRTDVDSIFLQD
jgi:hypothetical protein